MPPRVAPRRVVPVGPYSDGDATHRPAANSNYSLCDPQLYLDKLGQRWMEEQNAADPGVLYSLEHLPAGYEVYDRPRPSDPKHRDRYLFGHPNRKPFDSPNRFYPHFKFLMEQNGNGGACDCVNCNANTSSMASKKIVDLGIVDDEGTPAIYDALCTKLEKEGKVDEPIVEKMSMDWRAEHHLLPYLYKKLATQESFIPRVGELVLFVADFRIGDHDGELAFDHEAQEHRVYDKKTKEFIGYPIWAAGTVGQVNVEKVVLADLVAEQPKEYIVSLSGFRVECLPDPNSDYKGLSKQYKYVPLHHIRPFNFYAEYLKGTPEEEWDLTIKHALTVMASWSLISKYHFKGEWPNATVSCKGLFVGAENYFAGDFVRMLPRDPESHTVHDILRIQTIEFKFVRLDLDGKPPTETGETHKLLTHVTGPMYTLDATRAKDPTLPPLSEEAAKHLLPQGYHAFRWYRASDPDRVHIVSYTQILGRCFELDALHIWFSRKDAGVLSLGLDGVRKGRIYSAATDQRVGKDRDWFWAEHRVEALDIATLNGAEVGRFDKSRDPAVYRTAINVIDGLEEPNYFLVKRDPFPKPDRTFTAVNSSLVASAQQDDDDEDEEIPDARDGRNGNGDEDELAATAPLQPRPLQPRPPPKLMTDEETRVASQAAHQLYSELFPSRESLASQDEAERARRDGAFRARRGSTPLVPTGSRGSTVKNTPSKDGTPGTAPAHVAQPAGRAAPGFIGSRSDVIPHRGGRVIGDDGSSSESDFDEEKYAASKAAEAERRRARARKRLEWDE
ncbi:MAG: hypothetical protein M1819_000711 [Sarea resinae]|nr:MAG: hypothetical protein M1819_000711 [Sarea resinae]